MEYFILDGLDRKGPYTEEELKSRNVTGDTLVYSEGMKIWTKIKDLPELYDLVFPKISNEVTKTPSSLDIISAENPLEQNPSHNLILNKKKKIPSILFLLLGILLAIGISYLLVRTNREKDLANLTKKIDNVLGGKNQICDRQNTGVTGNLYRVEKTNDSTLFYRSPQGTNFFWHFLFGLEEFEQYKQLTDYYECKEGGFTVLTLKKVFTGFEIVENKSDNMGFKTPAFKTIPGKDYGYGITTPGYNMPTGRPSIQGAYTGAMEFLTSEKEDKSYVPGCYGSIESFGEINSDYFHVENIYPTKYSSGSENAKSWTGKSFIFTNYWIVLYNYNGKHYEIVENKNYLRNKWIIYSLIASIILSLIYFIFQLRKRFTV